MRPTFSFFVLTFALLIVTTQSGFGQDKISGGSGGFHIGSKFYNTQNYSYFLEDGVADLNNNLLSIGGEGYMVYKNFMIGGRGFYQGGESRDVAVGSPLQDSRNYTYSLNGGGGYLTLGYAAYSKNDLLIFPQLGIGIESLSLEKSLNETVVFEPQESLSAEYSWSSPMLDIGIGADWFPFKNGTKIGLRLGYTISLQRNSNWSHSGGEFIKSDLPENNLNGFYVNLVIGGGGFTTKN
mgnify:CR=1 FL=1